MCALLTKLWWWVWWTHAQFPLRMKQCWQVVNGPMWGTLHWRWQEIRTTHLQVWGRAAVLIAFHICWEVSARLSSGSLTPSIFTSHVTAVRCGGAGQHMEAILTPRLFTLNTTDEQGLKYWCSFVSSFKWNQKSSMTSIITTTLWRMETRAHRPLISSLSVTERALIRMLGKNDFQSDVQSGATSQPAWTVSKHETTTKCDSSESQCPPSSPP